MPRKLNEPAPAGLLTGGGQASEGRIPPQAVDVEKQVIGIMLNYGKKATQVCMMYLDPKDLYNPTNARMYTAILTTYSKQSPIDTITVHETLRTLPGYNPAEDPLYLTECTASVTTDVNLQHYCQILSEKAIARTLLMTCMRYETELYRDAEDVLQLAEKLQREVREARDRAFVSSSKLLSDSRSSVKEMLARIREGKSFFNKRFNIFQLDDATGGMGDGDLIIISGLAKSGKTTLALQVAEANARDRVTVQIFSQEMSRDQLLLRLAIIRSGIRWTLALQNRLTDEEWTSFEKAIEMCAGLDIYVNDNMNSISTIESEVASHKESLGTGLVIVDYIQLVKSDAVNSSNREQEVADIALRLKGIAKDNNVPVIALSQLTDDYRTRESRAIEHNLDKHITLKRDIEGEKIDTGDENIVQVDVRLVQRMGPSGAFGDLNLGYDMRCGKFVNIEKYRNPIPADERQPDPSLF